MKDVLGFLVLITGAFIGGDTLDVAIDLPDTYKKVLAGDDIWYTVRLMNMSEDEIFATLTVEILDSDGKVRASSHKRTVLEPSLVDHFTVPSNLEYGLYSLKITVNCSDGHCSDSVYFAALETPNSIQGVIESSLFDIIVEIPDNYRIISPGEELLTSIKLINVGSAGRVDVFLDYSIFDASDNVVLKKRETVAVETQANFVRTFDIPDDALGGNYRFYALLTYADGKIADSDHSFKVISSRSFKGVYFAVAALVITTLVMLSLFRYTPVIQKMHMRAKVKRIVRRKLKE